MQHIPCAVTLLRVAGLIVHGGPRPCAAADIDRVARLHGDALRALIEAEALGVACDLLVEEYLGKEVLIAGGGGKAEVSTFALDGQGVLVQPAGLAGGEGACQLTALDLQRLYGGVAVAPGAAQIGAQTLAGVHDADDIAVRQLAVGHGEGREALVGEPVVQGTHPAGLRAAVKLTQRLVAHSDGGDVVAVRTVLLTPVILQGGHDAGHHGAVGGQSDLIVHRNVVPESLSVRPHIFSEGGILHDDPHLAVVVDGLAHGHHSGLIGSLHRSDRGGGVDVLHALVIGFLRLVAQAVIQRLQAGESGAPGGGHGLFAVGGHGLILRLGDHLHVEGYSAAVSHIAGDNILRQIVARPIHAVNARQRQRLGQVPRVAAVHRPHGPILLIRGVQVVAQEHMVARHCRCRQTAAEPPPVAAHRGQCAVGVGCLLPFQGLIAEPCRTL